MKYSAITTRTITMMALALIGSVALHAEPNKLLTKSMDLIRSHGPKNNIIRIDDLIEEDPSILNQQDEIGNTLLSYAAQLGHADIVKALLAYEGINVNVPDMEGHTPLSIAIVNNDDSIIKLLKKKGATVNAVFELRIHNKDLPGGIFNVIGHGSAKPVGEVFQEYVTEQDLDLINGHPQEIILAARVAIPLQANTHKYGSYQQQAKKYFDQLLDLAKETGLSADDLLKGVAQQPTTQIKFRWIGSKIAVDFGVPFIPTAQLEKFYAAVKQAIPKAVTGSTAAAYPFYWRYKLKPEATKSPSEMPLTKKSGAFPGFVPQWLKQLFKNLSAIPTQKITAIMQVPSQETAPEYAVLEAKLRG